MKVRTIPSDCIRTILVHAFVTDGLTCKARVVSRKGKIGNYPIVKLGWLLLNQVTEDIIISSVRQMMYLTYVLSQKTSSLFKHGEKRNRQ